MAKRESASRSQLLPQLTEVQFYALVGAVALLLVGVVVKLRFCGDVSLPEKPPAPKATAAPSATAASAALDSTSAGWKQHLIDSAKRYSTTPDIEQMIRVFPHRQETARHRLIPGTSNASVEASGLRITAQTRDTSGTRLLVLVIENRTDRDLAYRVDARPMRGQQACRRGFIPLSYDALVVPAGGSVTRAECKHREKWGIDVTRVETMALPTLAARQLSDTPADLFGLDSRLVRGHEPASRTCRVAVSASTRHAIGTGKYRWRDVVDFFARHSCHVYKRLPDGYRAFERDNERPLPATD